MDKINRLTRLINNIVDNSELVYMAKNHFDTDSNEMMINELKDKLLEELNNFDFTIEL